MLPCSCLSSISHRLSHLLLLLSQNHTLSCSLYLHTNPQMCSLLLSALSPVLLLPYSILPSGLILHFLHLYQMLPCSCLSSISHRLSHLLLLLSQNHTLSCSLYLHTNLQMCSLLWPVLSPVLLLPYSILLSGLILHFLRLYQMLLCSCLSSISHRLLHLLLLLSQSHTLSCSLYLHTSLQMCSLLSSALSLVLLLPYSTLLSGLILHFLRLYQMLLCSCLSSISHRLLHLLLPLSQSHTLSCIPYLHTSLRMCSLLLPVLSPVLLLPYSTLLSGLILHFLRLYQRKPYMYLLSILHRLLYPL